MVSAPAATFTLPDTSVAVAELVTFTNQSGGQPPLRYTWDFGDGVTSDGGSLTVVRAEPNTLFHCPAFTWYVW